MLTLDWVFYISALYIAIFIFLVILKTIFKDKIKKIDELASVSGSSVGLFTSLVSFCLACTMPILGFFGFLFNFPPLLVALMLGSSIFGIGEFISMYLEKKKKDFIAHKFIINLSLTILAILLLFLMYGGEKEENVHIHSYLRIFSDGEEMIIYNESNMDKQERVHFHPNQPNAIHIHQSKITLQDFLDSIEFSMSLGNCKHMIFIVNGQSLPIQLNSYIMQDKDLILLTCYSGANITYNELYREWDIVAKDAVFPERDY